MTLAGRVALVTGASSGIGLATARALAAEGCGWRCWPAAPTGWRLWPGRSAGVTARVLALLSVLAPGAVDLVVSRMCRRATRP